MTDRRTFVRTLALATAACAAPRDDKADSAAGATATDTTRAAGSTGDRRLDRIGIQLYTLRTALEADVDGTLARLKQIGYAEVETAGFHGRTPAQFRQALDANGLAAPSAHMPLAEVRDRTAATLDAAKAIGAQYVVLPWLEEKDRQTLDQYRAVADVLNRAGEAAKGAGLRMAYHNHDFEFVPIGGTRPIDLLLERTTPDLVSFELDLYWTVKAGGDPFAFFSRWPGRFPMVHVKDSAGPPEHRMVDVGAGSIPFGRYFAQREQAGIRHYFVEHDVPKDPFESLKASYGYVKGLNF